MKREENMNDTQRECASRKTAVVTGASRGIGRAAALKMASIGMNVALIAGHESDALKEAVKAVEDLGVKAKGYAADVSDGAAVAAAVQKISAEFDDLDVLVNDAGITRDGLFLSMKDEDVSSVIGVNLEGTMLMTKALLPFFMRRRSGRIVNLSSVVGLSGNVGQANYAASKAGVIGFTKSIALEYARKGITCNAVAPGFIGTDMTAKMTDAAKEKVLGSIAMKRMGTCEEVADLIGFLVCDQSRYITGQVIAIDGGMQI